MSGNLCGNCQKRPADRMSVSPKDGAMRACQPCHDLFKGQYGCLCDDCTKETKTMAKKKTNGHAEHGPDTGGDGASKPIEIDRYEEHLPCKIASDVVHGKAIELAEVIRDRDVVLNERREANVKFRDRLNAFNERLMELAEAVNGNVEKRNVECVDYLLPTNEVRTIRTDTGEVLETRAATAEELQQEIPGAGKRTPAPQAEPTDAPAAP